MFSEKDIEYIEKSWQVLPLSVIAGRLNVDELTICKILREKSISKEVKAVEIQFILENIDKMPPKEIQNRLCMTSTQFSQIMQKKIGIRQNRPFYDMTKEEVLLKTRRLIENKLKWEIDDFLPREIRTTHFSENNLSVCLDYANHYKKYDNYYCNFSAVAYLVCNAYPSVFKPYQFSNSKDNRYFIGITGKKNYLRAVMWVVTEKLKIRKEYIASVVDSNSFLRKADLQFYGLGEFWYRKHFSSKAQLINELIKFYNIEVKQFDENTRELRNKLEQNGIPIDVCFINECDCNESIDIHHIIAKEKKLFLPNGVDIDDVNNLIPLCPNHHRKASNFNYGRIIREDKTNWRKLLVEFVKE